MSCFLSWVRILAQILRCWLDGCHFAVYIDRYRCLNLVLESLAFIIFLLLRIGFTQYQMEGHGRKEEGRYKERKIAVV
jgi:hypothetical protein